MLKVQVLPASPTNWGKVRVKKNEIATIVKIADIKHNLSCDLKAGQRRDKYMLAKYILETL